MEDGYLLDETHGGRLQGRWVSGEPEKGLFGVGVRIKNHEVLPVVARRCKACGWLDLYARDAVL